jgi:hypothetical protein
MLVCSYHLHHLLLFFFSGSSSSSSPPPLHHHHIIIITTIIIIVIHHLLSIIHYHPSSLLHHHRHPSQARVGLTRVPTLGRHLVDRAGQTRGVVHRCHHRTTVEASGRKLTRTGTLV